MKSCDKILARQKHPTGTVVTYARYYLQLERFLISGSDAAYHFNPGVDADGILQALHLVPPVPRHKQNITRFQGHHIWMTCLLKTKIQ